eukprot:s352_g5.t1
MAVAVQIVLLSGRATTVRADEDETVAALKLRAQTTLGVGKGRLMDSSGSVLDESSTLKAANVQDGASLTLRIIPVQVRASAHAFAAILGDGLVVTWGDATAGGDSASVQARLEKVQQIQGSQYAFAAIRDDGSVVTWGNASSDSRAVKYELQHVQQLQASLGAFAAIRLDGSVVTWGETSDGGDSSAVQDQLQNVQQIQASFSAFAAILGNGFVVTWGSDLAGGDSSAVQPQLKDVRQIQASSGAFAAILGDGSVVTWGGDDDGGDSSSVQDQLQNVQQIQASFSAFAAIRRDGSVATWGDAGSGGDSSAVQCQLKNVQQIQASQCAFAAVLGNGSVVTWGDAGYGGDSSVARDQLNNVRHIQASGSAFAAILGDGSVVTWGEAFSGGDSGAVQGQLKNVQQVHASWYAFAAILDNGSLVTWGDVERCYNELIIGALRAGSVEWADHLVRKAQEDGTFVRGHKNAVDLHLMRVPVAQFVVLTALRDRARAEVKKPLTIITGVGRHSRDEAVIKPMVIDLLQELQLPCRWREEAGHVQVAARSMTSDLVQRIERLLGTEELRQFASILALQGFTQILHIAAAFRPDAPFAGYPPEAMGPPRLSFAAAVFWAAWEVL